MYERANETLWTGATQAGLVNRKGCNGCARAMRKRMLRSGTGSDSEPGKVDDHDHPGFTFPRFHTEGWVSGPALPQAPNAPLTGRECEFQIRWGTILVTERRRDSEGGSSSSGSGGGRYILYNFALINARVEMLPSKDMIVHSKHLGDGASGFLVLGFKDKSVAKTFIKGARKCTDWMFDELYYSMNTINSGSFGRVFECRYWITPNDWTETVFAAKVIKHNHQRTLGKQGELDIIERLEHPNVLPVIDILVKDDETYIVMPKMQTDLWGLLRRLGPLQENQLREVMYQLLQGLTYLRQTWNMIHRDLKPGNVLVNYTAAGGAGGSAEKFDVRIADFGHTHMANSVEARHLSPYLEQYGTNAYMAPELLDNLQFTHASDVWALGVCMYELATREVPFGGATRTAMFGQIRQAQMPLHSRIRSLSEDAREVLLAMLQKDYLDRQSSARLLANDWFAVYRRY